MPDRVYNVLFLCTGNSVRSILAEAMLNKEGQGHFRAFSAGRQPKGQTHPLALQTFTETDYTTEALRSKSWDEFAALEAPHRTRRARGTPATAVGTSRRHPTAAPSSAGAPTPSARRVTIRSALGHLHRLHDVLHTGASVRKTRRFC